MEDELRIGAAPPAADLVQLDDEICRFDAAATGDADRLGLAIFLRGAGGALRAGLAGHTWGGCL